MIKESKVQYERTEYHRFCDECGEEIITGLGFSVAKCVYCNKELCWKCMAYEDANQSTSRIVYCKNCWKVGEEYRPTIEELNSRIQDLYKEWQNKCCVETKQEEIEKQDLGNNMKIRDNLILVK